VDFAEVRRLTVTALFADDELVEKLVLKGGNALSLVHRLSPRASLDLDFSIEEDFDDLEDIRQRVFRTLKNRFDSAGYVVFDESLQPKPRLEGQDERPWWGGYELRFKLISREKYDLWRDAPEKRRFNALVVGFNQQRTFTVHFSKHEYTQGKVERDLDYYTIYVYTPAMVAVEKLRAICQQMPVYFLKGQRRPRARDFFDIHLVVTKAAVDLASPENLELIRNIFAAKLVPLALLGGVGAQREFHRPDWPAVVASVGEPLEEFDHYFDFVVNQVERLKTLWEEQPPL